MSHPFDSAMRQNNRRGQPPIQPLPLADPDHPFRVHRSHLEKMELGKSSSSCKVSLTLRLHRKLVVQEIWCASFEEACVYQNIAANVNVVAIREQFTRLNYVDEELKARSTITDAHVLLRNSDEVLVSVKYNEKATRSSYKAEVANIARQSLSPVADRFIIASRYFFHPTYRANAMQIYHARMAWDPEADRIVLDAANDITGPFRFSDVVEKSRSGARGHRAMVRLLGDGDISMDQLDPINDRTLCELPTT